MKGYFITGTDTDCGKTRVACALIHHLRGQGLSVAPFKPVAAGAQIVDGRLRNSDALDLIAASGADWPYAQVNPYCFAPPVSPHIAAAEAGVDVDVDGLLHIAGDLAAYADLLLVEGAGGWHVPLGPELDIQALALALGLPVILVVGLRLGCLNHALLSAAAIARSGLPLAGWIGSVRDPGMLRLQQNIDTLHASLRMPCLGILPPLAHDDTGEHHLSLAPGFAEYPYKS